MARQVSMYQMDLPPASEMVDPELHIFLVDGKVMVVHHTSITEITRSLLNNGVVYLGDGRGEYLVLFHHGVAAITAGTATHIED